MMPEIRLLLVDDDEANREVLRRRLVRSGYAVDTAADGMQALAAVRSRVYDLVLLDNMMPGLSGPQVLQRIRETWPPAELPVIMVTALDDSEHVVTALREGANDYLTKPLDFPVALARIESHLRVASAARETRRARELYQLASRASDDGLWEWDPAAGTVRYDQNWLSAPQQGGNSTTVTLEKWLEEAHPAEHAAIRQSLQSSLTEDAGLNCEYRVRSGDGRCGWAELRGRVLRNAAGEAVRVVGHLSNITGRKTIDPLTALPNRLWLAGEIHQALTDGYQPALLLFDIDGFERMEQSFPEGSAGRLLVAVAARLRDFVNARPTPQAVVARTGEHQFGVLLPQVAGPREAREFAERLRDVLRQPLDVDGEEVFAAASIGIAVLPPGSAEEDAFRNAGAALRHARELGGGRAEMFDEHQRHLALVETRLENDLRRALENHEFEVHYQPKVRLRDGEITSLEALVRWNRPGQGMLFPNVFIPAAERTGLVVPLGQWVLDRAVSDVAKLRSRYPALGVSVNVSGRQLTEPDLVEQIAASLAAAGLEPTALHLEITETFLVQDPEMALTKLARIRSMGVGLKLDDFGSGYASLDYLQRFPFDSIKVDRSFVARLHSSRESAEIMRAVIGLAHSLDMSVIAEGIETPEQLSWLREMGCNYGQGYLFSRPVPLDQVTRLLEEIVRRKSAGKSDAMTANEMRAGREEAQGDTAWSTAGVVVSGETD